MKHVGCLILAVILVLTSAACGRGAGDASVDPAIAAMTDEEYFSAEFRPVFRLLICSDIHIADGAAREEDARVGQMFDRAYAYIQEQGDGVPLSAVLVAGDIADNGWLSEMKRCVSILKRGLQGDTQLWISMGNHDYYEYGEKSPMMFCEAAGYESADNHVVIDGYHVILISPDKNGKGYSDEKQDFLKQALKEAARDDPTGRKPIFVVHHHHVSDTVYGSDRWGSEDLKAILKKYPQVVDFSGHSHFPIDDPKSVWQGEFTALGTGTLSYGEVGIAGVYPDSVWPVGTDGGYTTTAPWESGGVKSKDLAQFYIAEVDGNQAIRILGYDLLSDGFFMDPILLRSVGDPKNFVYTDARAEASEAPYFDADAALTEAESPDAGQRLFRFPQAHSKDVVQHYRYTVEKDGEIIDTDYRLSCTFYTPAPETLTVPIALKGSGHYLLTVTAVNSFAKDGQSLTAEFDVP